MADVPRPRALDAYSELVQQLRDDVGAVVEGIIALIGPSHDPDLAMVHIVHDRATMWAAQLLGDDDREAAGVVLDLMGVLWPHGEPDTAWWRTPIGQAVARSVGHPSAESVSYSVAGSMIGCSKQWVAKLIEQDRLRRHPDGGVHVESVSTLLRHRVPSASAGRGERR